jgi:hypothetical protein
MSCNPHLSNSRSTLLFWIREVLVLRYAKLHLNPNWSGSRSMPAPMVSKVPLPLNSRNGLYPNILICAVSLPQEYPCSTGSYKPFMPNLDRRSKVGSWAAWRQVRLCFYWIPSWDVISISWLRSPTPSIIINIIFIFFIYLFIFIILFTHI